jgi:hypothetical protein
MAEWNRRQLVNSQNRDAREYLVELGSDISKRQKHEAALKAQIDVLMKEMTDSCDMTGKLLVKKGELEEAAAKLVDADENEVKDKIASAGGINEKIRANADRSKIEEKLKDLRSKSTELTAKLEDIQREQKEALEKAAWPIPGLSVDDDGVLYRGLPIEQECTSSRTLISTQIGMALNPRLKLLVCQGGNDLGNAALESLQSLLEKHEFQMLLEVVTRSPEDEARCAVVIEDGRVAAGDTV